MFFIVGALVVMVSVLGGYAAMGGQMYVLMQPFEVVIILGAAIGAFVIANSKQVLAACVDGFKTLLSGSKYKKDDYVELLSLLYQIFRLAKTKGMLALEKHVEQPEESQLFQQFPKIAADHHAMTFLCDYLRMLTLGTDNPHELENLIRTPSDPWVTPPRGNSRPAQEPPRAAAAASMGRHR